MFITSFITCVLCLKITKCIIVFAGNTHRNYKDNIFLVIINSVLYTLTSSGPLN